MPVRATQWVVLIQLISWYNFLTADLHADAHDKGSAAVDLSGSGINPSRT